MGTSSSVQAARETNENNLKIAQMNNDWNEHMYDRQEAYNREMYQKQYDDSTNYADKVAKLKAAGLNPALFFGSASGTSSALGVSTPTASEVGRQVVPDVASDNKNLIDAINGVSSSALGAAQVLGENTLKFAQAKQVNQEAYYTPARLRSQIYNTTQQGNKAKYEANSAQIKSNVDALTQDASVQAAYLGNDLTQSNIDYQVQQTCNAKIEHELLVRNVDWFDKTKTQELAESAQRCALMVKQGQLSEAQAKTEIYKRIELSASAAKQKADADTLNKMRDVLYESAVLSYDRADEELGNLRKYGTPTPTSTTEITGEGHINGGINNGVPNFSVGGSGSYKTRYNKKLK